MKSFIEFITEEASEHDSDFNSLKGKLDDMGVDHSIHHNPRTNTIHISKIVVNKHERGSGKGSAAMNLITSHADKHNKTVTLSPSTDFGASSVARLKKFYKSHGFNENKGKHKDYTISDSMYRTPK